MPTNSPARPDSPSRPDLEGLRKLDAAATPAPWCVYSEPEVGLPPSLFSGTVMESGFGPIEPLTGYDLDLVAAMRSQLPSLIAHVERLEESLNDLRNAGWAVLIGLNERIAQADPKAVPLFAGIAELSDALHAADSTLSQGTSHE